MKMQPTPLEVGKKKHLMRPVSVSVKVYNMVLMKIKVWMPFFVFILSLRIYAMDTFAVTKVLGFLLPPCSFVKELLLPDSFTFWPSAQFPLRAGTPAREGMRFLEIYLSKFLQSFPSSVPEACNGCRGPSISMTQLRPSRPAFPMERRKHLC